MQEIEQMIEAIKNGNIHKNLRLIYEDIPENIRHIVNIEINKKASKDLKTINDALELISKYEKDGVKFNFINYQTN